MRKSAAEYIRELEGRIARLERTAVSSGATISFLRMLAGNAYNNGSGVLGMRYINLPRQVLNNLDLDEGFHLQDVIALGWVDSDMRKYKITPKGIDAILRDAVS
tara:strand:- start:134 stop:445 length:312 start_codon:yes stop_codon:yes gene_type:complete